MQNYKSEPVVIKWATGLGQPGKKFARHLRIHLTITIALQLFW